MRYKRRQVTQVDYDARTMCDGCGKDIHHDSIYDGDEITIEAALGDVYPGSDDRRLEEVDVCPACWVEKVRPAIEALGFVFRERDAGEDTRVLESGEA